MPLTTQEVARLLGITVWNVESILRSGKVPPPGKNSSGDRTWLDEDVSRLRAALNNCRRRHKAAK